MKIVARAALIFGLAAMAILILREGPRSILVLLCRVGWLGLLLVPLHALPLLADVIGWRALIVGRVRLGVLFVIACIREAVSRLLPMAGIGGEWVGIRLLAAHGLDSTSSAASVVVELSLTVAAQWLFASMAAACLLRSTGAFPVAGSLGLIAGAGLLVPASFILLLRAGSIFGRLGRLAERLLGGNGFVEFAAGRGIRLDNAVRKLFGYPLRLTKAFCWQLTGLFLGCGEAWLILRWLGHPVGFESALVLEGSVEAARHLFFLVPAAVGVQEVGLIAAAYALGISQDMAIALSLIKRMREILFGLPALATWHWMEARRSAG